MMVMLLFSGKILTSLICYGAEESASLKKLYKVDNKMMLQPCNSDYTAEFVDSDDVVIVGECIGTYHAR